MGGGNTDMATANVLTPTETPKRNLTVPRTKPNSSRKKSPAAVKKTATTMTYAQFQRMSVVGQIRRAFMPGARVAAALGVLLGGAVPFATYILIHDPRGVASSPVLWLLVAGCFLYSAPKVFGWMQIATGSNVAALGFTVLAEGILSFSYIPFFTCL